MNVKNHADEDLGSINDLAIEPMDGRVAYAAVSMGGFLGVGDKLFAVPWDAIECRQVDDEFVAYLDIDRQRMENAKGFDQDNWPDMANEQWRTETARRFQSSRRAQRHEVLRPVQPGSTQQQPSDARRTQSDTQRNATDTGARSGSQSQSDQQQPGSQPQRQ